MSDALLINFHDNFNSSDFRFHSGIHCLGYCKVNLSICYLLNATRIFICAIN
jgi:hypothetical protein